MLGPPIDEVTDYGPGAAQYFRGGTRNEPVVVCALPGRPAIAVAGSIWETLAGLGGGVARGGGLAAAGFPVADNTSAGNGNTALIPNDVTEVSVNGGSWGTGRLLRPGRQANWSWEPVPRTDFNTFHTTRWTVRSPTDLQIRAIASLPWLTDSPLKIGIPGRQRLIETLEGSELSAWVEGLSQRRGAKLPASKWDWATGQGSWQSDRSAHCLMTMPGPGGEAAVTAEVMTQLPDGLYLTVLGAAELRINFQPWAAALTAAGAAPCGREALRVTVPELASFYTVAWAAASLLAPLTAVESPLAMPPAGPPRVEFQFKVSPYHDSTPRSIELDDVIDLLAVEPPTSDSYRHEGGFGITTPLNLPSEQRQALIEEQLAGLAQAWGFIYATPRMLHAADDARAREPGL